MIIRRCRRLAARMQYRRHFTTTQVIEIDDSASQHDRGFGA